MDEAEEEEEEEESGKSMAVPAAGLINGHLAARRGMPAWSEGVRGYSGGEGEWLFIWTVGQ